MARGSPADKADVAPAKASGPVDSIDGGIGAGAGGIEIAPEGGDAEHPSALGDDAIAGAPGPRMEDLDRRIARRRFEPADLAAGLRRPGVPLGGHHDAYRGLVPPAQVE